MKPIRPETALGWFVGAGLVYLFVVILDLVVEGTFDGLYFFLYWDIILAFMIIFSQTYTSPKDL